MSATVTMSAVAAKTGARLSSRAISKQVRTPITARPIPNFAHSHVDNPLFPFRTSGSRARRDRDLSRCPLEREKLSPTRVEREKMIQPRLSRLCYKAFSR